MYYVSTRGTAPELAFDDVLLTGLARDGGLYVPASWPRLDEATLRGLRGAPYADVAVAVMRPFVAGTIDDASFEAIVRDAYSGFDHQAVVPLTQLNSNLWIMELFHGQTLAFKDVALQLLGRLFDHVLTRRGTHVTIVGATSGDTGSAAIEACRGREAIDISVFHPNDRVSQVQRRQMTTVLANNVHNVALNGTFDDCQDAVKAMFADHDFRDAMNLSAVNSINWARIMAQVVYYVTSAISLGAPDRSVAFSVPTGNFGNIFAAYAARAMGLPIEKLIVGTNENDILDRFFKTGEMAVADVRPTLSPSMDIQISSNFERLLFDLLGRDGGLTSETLVRFRETGRFTVSADQLARARNVFVSTRLDDDGTIDVISKVYKDTGMLIDPHTAIGVAAAGDADLDRSVPVIALGCAHPAKFPDAVESATGVRPDLPARLADLFERPERYDVLENDMDAIKHYVASHSRRGGDWLTSRGVA